MKNLKVGHIVYSVGVAPIPGTITQKWTSPGATTVYIIKWINGQIGSHYFNEFDYFIITNEVNV